MKHRLLHPLTGALAAVFLFGCSAAPKDAGFGDVQHLISDRTGGMVVQWNMHTADDQSVTDAVNKMLSRDLTADQAVQIALLNNHHLQATFEDLGIAQADLVQAGLLKNPVFDLGVRFPDRAPAGTYLDFAVAEDFLDVALLPARKKLAAAQFEEAKLKVADQVFELVAQTRADFYACQAAAQVLSFRRTLAQSADASLDAAKKLHDVGNINDLTFSGERAQDIRFKIDLTDAEADAAEAREKISAQLGLSPAQLHWTAAPLPELPQTEIPDLNLEALAIKHRQDLAAARQEIVVQARTLGLTADYRFFDSASIGPEFERETDGQWRIGPTVSLPLPLFDQGQARISRSKAMLRQSEQRCLAMISDIQSQVRTAREKLFSARAKALLYRDQVLPIQRDLLNETELHYNGMYLGLFQLLQARQEQVDASRQFIEALRDYWTARAQLEQAIGGRLPSAASATQSMIHGETP